MEFMRNNWFRLGFVAFVAIAICTVVGPVQLLKREDSPYDVPEWQVAQLEKVRAFASIGGRATKKEGE